MWYSFKKIYASINESCCEFQLLFVVAGDGWYQRIETLLNTSVRRCLFSQSRNRFPSFFCPLEEPWETLRPNRLEYGSRRNAFRKHPVMRAFNPFCWTDITAQYFRTVSALWTSRRWLGITRPRLIRVMTLLVRNQSTPGPRHLPNLSAPGLTYHPFVLLRLRDATAWPGTLCVDHRRLIGLLIYRRHSRG